MKIFRNITAAAILGTKLVATLPLQFDRRGVLSVYTHFSHPSAQQQLTEVQDLARVTIADPFHGFRPNLRMLLDLRRKEKALPRPIKTRVIES